MDRYPLVRLLARLQSASVNDPATTGALALFLFGMRQMTDALILAIVDRSLKKLANLSKSDEEVDTLHLAIIRYLGQLSQPQLVSPQMEMLSNGIAVTRLICPSIDLFSCLEISRRRSRQITHWRRARSGGRRARRSGRRIERASP